MKNIFYLPLVALLLTLFYFYPMITEAKLPIPADTIIGLYHPFRDLYASTNPNGIAYKNFLITDPVRQQYPWRFFAIDLLGKLQLPLWNPYTFSGSPLLANVQSAALYPLNIVFMLVPFQVGWSLQVVLQPLLFGLFLYLYLRNLRIDSYASFLGSIVIAFCGFSVAWLEWNTVLHTALWLPLILLGIDKIISVIDHKNGVKKRKLAIWSMIFVFAVSASLLAGHLQTFFYLLILTICYLFVRVMKAQNKGKVVSLFSIYGILITALTAVVWYPTVQFISLSARSIDLDWHAAGWFLPWQHLIQFVIPDYFGNPTTLNYWGIWNYAEFSGYIGIVPLLFALYAVLTRRDKKTYLLLAAIGTSFIMVLPTPIATIPFLLQVPFIATAQPTRLLFVIDFCLAILAVLGFDHYIKNKKQMSIPIMIVSVLFVLLWIGTIMFGQSVLHISAIDMQTAKRNLYLPTSILVGGIMLLVGIPMLKGKAKRLAILALIALTIFDLFRFFTKFTPFTNPSYLYPSTKVISFLQQHVGSSRVMETDARILPPNFTLMYKIPTVDGYDPLYLKRYGEFIAASERGKPDISPPFGFNRIITPQNYNSPIMSLLNVRYVLSLTDIQDASLKQVLEEGQTRVYEKTTTLPKVYFVNKVITVSTKQQAMNTIFSQDFQPLGTVAVVEKSGSGFLPTTFDSTSAHANIVKYEADTVLIKTQNTDPGFLVLSDIFYPTWHAQIDGKETEIYLTDFTLRGVIVPAGEHSIMFVNRFK